MLSYAAQSFFNKSFVQLRYESLVWKVITSHAIDFLESIGKIFLREVQEESL